MSKWNVEIAQIFFLSVSILWAYKDLKNVKHPLKGFLMMLCTSTTKNHSLYQKDERKPLTSSVTRILPSTDTVGNTEFK